jgi:hypothetical protein
MRSRQRCRFYYISCNTDLSKQISSLRFTVFQHFESIMWSTLLNVAWIVSIAYLIHLQWSTRFSQNAVLLPRSKTPIVMAAIPAFRSVNFDLLGPHTY